MIIEYKSNAEDVIACVDCDPEEVWERCPLGWRIITQLLTEDGVPTIIVEADDDEISEDPQRIG